MHRINSSKKVISKKASTPRKAGVKNKKFLELTVKKRSGEYAKLALPIKAVCVKTPRKKINLVKVDAPSETSIIIDNIGSGYISPQSLLRKKIHIKKDEILLEGIIVKVAAAKPTEGNPVPVPPPPLP